MEVALQSFVTTVVFIFCDPSQSVRGRHLHSKIKENFPKANVCLISGGNVSSNGNKTPIDTIVVSILAGSFTCEITPIEKSTALTPSKEAAGIFLFGFGTTDPE